MTLLRWALLGGFAAAVATRRQLWPFTPVPMFSHARDASWTRDCLTAEQAAQLAREALPSPTAFHETWYRLDAVLVPPAGASHPARRTLHPRHLAMAGEGHARGSLLVPEASGRRPRRCLRPRPRRPRRARGADRAFGAALNVSRVGGGAWADADVAPLAALLPLLEAHADYVAGYHQSDGEVCNASAAERRPAAVGAAVMGLELMLNSCEMGIVPLAAVRVDGQSLGCPRHPLGDVEPPPPAVATYYADGAAVADDAEAACAEWAVAASAVAMRTTCRACAAACARADAGAAAASALRVVQVLAAPRPRTGLRRVKRRARWSPSGRNRYTKVYHVISRADGGLIRLGRNFTEFPAFAKSDQHLVGRPDGVARGRAADQPRRGAARPLPPRHRAALADRDRRRGRRRGSQADDADIAVMDGVDGVQRAGRAAARAAGAVLFGHHRHPRARRGGRRVPADVDRVALPGGERRERGAG